MKEQWSLQPGTPLLLEHLPGRGTNPLAASAAASFCPERKQGFMLRQQLSQITFISLKGRKLRVMRVAGLSKQEGCGKCPGRREGGGCESRRVEAERGEMARRDGVLRRA